VTPLPERTAVAAIEPPEGLSAVAQPENVVVYGLARPARKGQPVEVVLADPNLIPDELPETASLRQSWPESAAPSVELADCVIPMDESGKPEALSLAALEPAPERKAAQKSLAEPVPVEKQEVAQAAVPAKESEVVVSLEPAKERPPKAAPAPAAPHPVKTAPSASIAAVEHRSAPMAPSTLMEAGKCYIQIGAYTSYASLEAATQKLNGAFAVTVETGKSGTASLYRLFIGPLGRDETGVALVQVKSLGFRDAFLK